MTGGLEAAVKLRQGQLWSKDGKYFRIVRWERLEIEFKEMADPADGDGEFHTVTKKEFWRLIKGADLVEEG